MPRLQPIFERHHDKGLNIVAVDIDITANEAQKFIAEKGLTFDFIKTKPGKNDPITTVYNVQSVPLNLIVDGEGRILYLNTGYKKGDEEKIEEQIRAVLGLDQ